MPFKNRPTTLILPSGATSGPEIILDGTNGTIRAISGSGSEIQLDPSNPTPIIRFKSQNGTNDAFINIDANTPSKADLGMNSGKYTPVDGVQRRGRIFMQSSFDSHRFEVIKESNQVAAGGYTEVATTRAEIGYNDANILPSITPKVKIDSSGMIQITGTSILLDATGSTSIVNVGNVQRWTKPSDEVRLSTATTLADDSILRFVINANQSYKVNWCVWYQSPAASDMKFNWGNFPLTNVNGFYEYEVSSSWGNAYPTASGWTTGIVPATTGAPTIEVFKGTGGIVAGAIGGSFGVPLQWASNTSGAGNTLVYAGSWIEAIRTA
jgi:hypothetical protein